MGLADAPYAWSFTTGEEGYLVYLPVVLKSSAQGPRRGLSPVI
jgi:hypothetical protein